MDQPIGKVTYTAMLNARGGIRCDLTVTRLAADRFLVITGGASGMHDLAWLRRHLPDDGSVQIQDTDLGAVLPRPLGAARPRPAAARQRGRFLERGLPLLHGAADHRRLRPGLAARVSYVGELGWELYAPTEYGVALWDTLWEAGQPLGIIAAGGGAFDSLRLEKGYRLWGADIHTEYNPYEAGLGFAVNLEERRLPRPGCARAQQSGGGRPQLCCLTFDDPRVVVMGKEPILDGDVCWAM